MPFSRRESEVPSDGSERCDQILAVACELFFSKGFAVATMRDVAQQTGFTQAAIYYHFASMDEILFALIDDFTTSLLSHLTSVMHQTDDPAPDLRNTIRAHIMITRTHYREIKLVIEDLAKRVDIAPITPAVAIFTELSAINFAYQWYRPSGPIALEKVADQTVENLIRGLSSSTLTKAAPAAARKRFDKGNSSRVAN